ncbi:MAG: MAPEG family protein [Pseudomonadota bacterium]
MVYPMFAMILLTFSVAIYMLKLRIHAVKRGELKLSYFRLNSGDEASTKLLQASRNYSNLFEMPVLFYAAGTIAIALHLEGLTIMTLSWTFVATRVVHSWIHLTNNNVIHRLKAFMLGNICVLLIWGQVVWEYTKH